MSDPVNEGVFKKKKYLRKCKECSNSFATNRKDRRYCCDKCRNKNWVKMNPRIKVSETNGDD